MPSMDRPGGGALALHYAAARGCLDCVRLLVEASPEIRQVPEENLISIKRAIFSQSDCIIL